VTKDDDIHIRIRISDRKMLRAMNITPTNMVESALQSLRVLWIQMGGAPSNDHIYNRVSPAMPHGLAHVKEGEEGAHSKDNTKGSDQRHAASLDLSTVTYII
jgi:hypothetical protein